VFSFHVKSGYHHANIFFLSIQHFWRSPGILIPFGLSSAPFIFTNLLKPFETFFRSQGILITIFVLMMGWAPGSPLPAARTVLWNTDIRNVATIVQASSMIQELQDLVLGILQFSVCRQIHLNVVWIPRDQNSTADILS